MAKVTLRPRYQTIDGILCPMFPPDHFKEALNYKPKSDDVFIVTYPKCGTTWIQNLVLYIFRKGKLLEDPQSWKKLSPFIDLQGKGSIDNMPRPGAFKTHLPYNRMPYSPEAKYIYVLRNPKDCCVSMYYHTKNVPGSGYSEATFDDFFEIFMSGEVEYNDYFDHMMSFYPHRNDSQMFYTTYETMKEDIKSVVLKLAAFLGQEYIEAIERDTSVLNNILYFSGFDYMKKNISQALTHHKDPEQGHAFEEKIDKPGSPLNNALEGRGVGHLRKGIVGDWRNHFSEEQSERLNKKFFEITQGTEILEMYKPFMV